MARGRFPPSTSFLQRGCSHRQPPLLRGAKLVNSESTPRLCICCLIELLRSIPSTRKGGLTKLTLKEGGDSHLDHFLRDLWPELIYDEIELLKSVGLKLRFILFGQKSEQTSWKKQGKEGEMGWVSASISTPFSPSPLDLPSLI